ncbi:unnamed protein product, partial [Effrenium voratum]
APVVEEKFSRPMSSLWPESRAGDPQSVVALPVDCTADLAVSRHGWVTTPVLPPGELPPPAIPGHRPPFDYGPPPFDGRGPPPPFMGGPPPYRPPFERPPPGWIDTRRPPFDLPPARPPFESAPPGPFDARPPFEGGRPPFEAPPGDWFGGKGKGKAPGPPPPGAPPGGFLSPGAEGGEANEEGGHRRRRHRHRRGEEGEGEGRKRRRAERTERGEEPLEAPPGDVAKEAPAEEGEPERKRHRRRRHRSK